MSIPQPLAEYERRKALLPPMPPDEYEDACKAIAKAVGL